MELENPKRRVLLAAAGAIGLSTLTAYVAAGPKERVIKVTAKKFDYTPSEISLVKGEPVVLEFTTQDVVMGFNAPDFGVRTDIVPGKVSQVRLTPDKTGTFSFHCDVFCGSGHEDMNGTIVVT
jgi:cytochrome c oxidase subunit 2